MKVSGRPSIHNMSLRNSSKGSEATNSPQLLRKRVMKLDGEQSDSDASDSDEYTGNERDSELFHHSVQKGTFPRVTEASYDLTTKEIRNKTPKQCKHTDKLSEVDSFDYFKLVLIPLTVAVGLIFAYCMRPLHVASTNLTIPNLKQQFPSQQLQLWDALDGGVQNTLKFNQPSVFLFIYERDYETTVNALLDTVAIYVSCFLNKNCDNKAIIINGTELNTKAAMKDYGHVINTYGERLEKSGVMIVKNLDMVSAQVAPAFHTFCDQYSPLVEKSFIIFTIAVNNFEGATGKNDFDVVEHMLSNKWSSLKQDIFNALFTRISNFIVRIKPEKFHLIEDEKL